MRLLIIDIHCKIEVRLILLSGCFLARPALILQECVAIFKRVAHESANRAQVSIADFKSEMN